MGLRKITIDNSVRYIRQSEQTRESKPNTVKNKSLPRKQSKKIQKITKKRFNKISA